MRRLASYLAALTPLLLTSACHDEGGSDSFAADAGRDTGFVTPDPEYECEPNLPALESGIFKRGCAFANCHTSAGYAGSLLLVETDLRAELVDADSIVCPGWKRVVPGSPEKSFLWNKLTFDTPACGVRMPWGVEPLPPHALDCVRNWISGLPRERDAAGQ
jgi:hypothetical protein